MTHAFSLVCRRAPARISKLLDKVGKAGRSYLICLFFSLLLIISLHDLFMYKLLFKWFKRVDSEKERHRFVITSDVGQQILSINKKIKDDWDKKQGEEAEKLRKANDVSIFHLPFNCKFSIVLFLFRSSTEKYHNTIQI